ARKVNGRTGVHRKDRKIGSAGIPLNRQILGSWPFEVNVVLQVRQSLGQIDRALKARSEVDDFLAVGAGVGLGDRVAQGGVPRDITARVVGQGVDRQREL